METFIIMAYIKNFFMNGTVRRFSILILIGLILFVIRDMLNLVLLTFLMAFLMNSILNLVTLKLSRYIPINSKVILIFLYLVMLTVIVVSIVNYMPKVFEQILQLKEVLVRMTNSPVPDDEVSRFMYKTLKDLNLQNYMKHGIEYILRISNWGTTFILATILSFFFSLEKKRIVAFTSRLSESKIAWFYVELKYFGNKFILSFGKVIEAQLLIALFNTIFTVIGLWVLGFPYLFALAIMIMLLSLIPVAGFLISLLPLTIIGYNIGGYWMVIYVIAMIMVLHFLEGYFLNPKLMSSKMNLPMFYTFIVLIFSEHYLGTWGLIVGIPIFIFLLDIIDVDTGKDVSRS
ncbi:AI-2E family transporter [Paenibacillus qinlingensis]|nr:AI-2E family transporter [Paenibacillus qinlingensis]